LNIVTMTIWQPDLNSVSGPRYLAIVDALAFDLDKGRLRAGDRLPTHRDLAYRLGLTVGTVTRAYAEAERRGLIKGEVGRGTYIRDRSGRSLPVHTHDFAIGESVIDLSMNFPSRPDADAVLSRGLQEMATDGGLGYLLDYHPHRGRADHRAAGGAWIKRHGLNVSPEQIVITNGGQHGMAVVLGTLAGPGDVVLTEAVTYPGVKALADLFRFELVGLPMDSEGILPDAFERACRSGRPRALFCMPSLQNPSGAHMPEERRREIAAIARRHGVPIVEDDIYGFLVKNGPAPLVTHAPELGFYLASLSKAIAPGLRMGYAAVPPEFVQRVTTSVRATTIMASPPMAELASRWIADGTGERLGTQYRNEAIARQSTAREMLRDLSYAAYPAGFHGWLTLPEHWMPAHFAAEMRQRGVIITPAEVFAVGKPVPPAIRICLSAARDRHELRHALSIIAELARGTPDFQHAIV
jgi:DNA-binding transcriptional MocR family regulator